MTLMTIADTPHSIALGSAIGIFFGFTPLYPLKTLLSIGTAWVCRCNKIAAAIAVTLHDVLIWGMPAIYLAEYAHRKFRAWTKPFLEVLAGIPTGGYGLGSRWGGRRV